MEQDTLIGEQVLNNMPVEHGVIDYRFLNTKGEIRQWMKEYEIKNYTFFDK